MPPATKRQILVVGLVLAIAAILPFTSSLLANFVSWDDDINIYDNPRVHGLNITNIAWMFTDLQQALRYKPLSWLSWACVYEVSGLRPVGYHLANLAFHAANSLLLFLLLRQLVLRVQPDVALKVSGRVVLLSCALGTLVWAWHPLRVEPVAWATGLPYGQALFFFLLSLCAYLQWADASRPLTQRRAFYLAALAAYGLAVLTYPIVLGFVPILCIIDIYPLARLQGTGKQLFRSAARLLMEKVPFVLVTAAIGIVTLVGRLEGKGIWHKAASVGEFGYASRFMQAFYVWATYVRKEFLPIKLSPVYTELLDFHPADPPFLLSAALVMALTCWLLFVRHRWPGMLTLWLCYLALAVPVLGLTEHPHFASDRYGHLPGVCWGVFAAFACMRLISLPSAKRWLGWSAIFPLAVLFVLSAQQTLVWHNTETLLQYAIKTLDQKAYHVQFYKLLAEFHLANNEPDKASRDAEAGLAIAPADADTREALVDALLRLHERDRAIAELHELLRRAPESAKFHYKLGVLLAEKGDVDEARAHQAALERFAGAGELLKAKQHLQQQIQQAASPR